MPNVRELAESLALLDIISRAVSFQPKIHLGTVWNIPVEFDNRLQTAAGNCHYHPSLLIKLNPVLRRDNHRVDLVETFLHELAHAHAWIVYGERGRGHGAEWWEMMHQLGQIPRRAHSIAACKKATTRSALSLEDMEL